MTKKPEPFRFGSMTKAELIRTIKALDKRQTKLLNRIAELEARNFERFERFPWETKT